MTDDLHQKLASYREALINCPPGKGESVFQKVADSYEDDLLELQDFPEDYFEFVLELLSKPEFFAKPGLWNFLLVLGTEQHKMHPRHYGALAERIINNYGEFLDKDLSLAVCDFIARNYLTADATSIFERLANIERKKPAELHGFVSEGLRILAAEETRRLQKTNPPQ